MDKQQINQAQQNCLLTFMLNPAAWVDESYKKTMNKELSCVLVEKYWGKPQLAKVLELEFDLPPLTGDQTANLAHFTGKLAICPAQTFNQVLLYAGLCKLSDALVKLIDKRILDHARNKFGQKGLGFVRNKDAQSCIQEALGEKNFQQVKYEHQDRIWALSCGLQLFWRAAPDLDEAWRKRVVLKIDQACQGKHEDIWELGQDDASKLFSTIANQHFATEQCLQ